MAVGDKASASDRANRRPLKSRDTWWAGWLASALARRGVRPNAVSLLSVLFAALVASALFYLPIVSSRMLCAALLLGAAVCVQLRLLCNLIDGMIAVEGGMKSASGEVYNDLPDRVSDVLIFVGAGYAAGAEGWGPPLGWLVALLSVFTAYVRLLGASLGRGHWFAGPMAKPHRMATLTAALVLSAVECAWGFEGRVLIPALALIALGAVVTSWRRAARIVRELEHDA